MANLELSSLMEPLGANGYLEHQLERELFLISVFFQRLAAFDFSLV